MKWDEHGKGWSGGCGALRGEALGVWVLALMEVGPSVGGGVPILDVGGAESLGDARGSKS